MKSGAEFFNDDAQFQKYMSGRQRAENANVTLEKPIFDVLVGDLKDKRILDLGCGDGEFGVEAIDADCQSYVGLEASKQMVAVAQDNLKDTDAQIIETLLEDWTYPTAQFDLIVSRMTLHYVEDLEALFQQVHQSLTSGGRLVFSVVHPVITSSNKSAEAGGLREDWIVDDYFVTGARKVHWMGDYVTQYHRAIEDYFRVMQKAGFLVEDLRESRPIRENFSHDALFERRQRIPLMLFLAGRKIE